MPDAELLWEIMQDVEAHALTVYRSNGSVADSEGPTLYSFEEFERFVAELRAAADRVWPRRKPCRRCGGRGRDMRTPGGGFDLNPGNRMYDAGPCGRCGGSGWEPE